MKPIKKGDRGAAVEDVQQRLSALGYDIGEEQADAIFGDKTAAALIAFRRAHHLDELALVDRSCWNILVDESFSMGDRSLYLRYPNFHGNDVKTLQRALNILGFSCGNNDGIYGVHTESAVKEFQANVGLFPDGIAFTETFEALERLHYSWTNKNPDPHGMEHMGLARTAQVIERISICFLGTDPIARNVAGRAWNLAAATSENSRFELRSSLNEKDKSRFDVIVELSSLAAEQQSQLMATVVLHDAHSLPSRIQTACKASMNKGDCPPEIRIEFEQQDYYDGSFTSRKAQFLAIELLDALCRAFEGNIS